MSRLVLERPLAVFDIEATGVSPRADRIVELCIIKIMPDESRSTHTFRINPGIHIPEETSEIHGIYDNDVKDCPSFSDLSDEIYTILEDCDLCGFNAIRYDIPMLTEEFLRVGKKFNTDKRSVVDPQRIFHRRVPRDLTAALSFYCGEEHTNAHGAESDVIATIKVLYGQMEKYTDLPSSVTELDTYCNAVNPNWVDKTGKLKWMNNEVTLNFGRKKGTSLKTLIDKDPNFIKWMLKSDFPLDTREIIIQAQKGIWPKK